MKIQEFDKSEFEWWLKRKLADSEDLQEINWQLESQIRNMSPFEMCCYLGEYLTMQGED